MSTLKYHLKSIIMAYNDMNILDVNIYCRVKNDEGTQYWFQFKKLILSSSIEMIVTHYTNYIKKDFYSKIISDFGKLENIFSCLITNELDNIVPLEKDITFLIGISHKNKIEYPLIELTISNFTKGYNLEGCPVCKGSWVTEAPIPLKCLHRVCVDCFLGIVKNGGTTCPVCRHDLFE